MTSTLIFVVAVFVLAIAGGEFVRWYEKNHPDD